MSREFSETHVFHMLSKGDETPLYFTTLSSGHYEKNIYRKNGFDDLYQLLFVLDGKGELICEGKSFPLKKDTAFFLAPHVPHSYKGEKGFRSAYITLKGSVVPEIVEYYGVSRFFIKENMHIQKYVTMLDEMKKEYYNKKREGILSITSYNILVSFFEDCFEKDLSELEKLCIYIEENFRNRLTLDELSKVYRSSVSKMCRDFKDEYGITLFQYIMDLRLDSAHSDILMNPQSKIKSVALYSGFNDVSYFCRAYKKKYGTSPMGTKR